ncbi:MAG: Planctomycete cytochrome, partial [Verrucomicrobiales bacterium]|nr:Planctomycete cytochrome [Verrucomicrobiales bacterium]
HCYACHGPDEAKRKAGLRLDNEQIALKELKSGARAIVPGDLKNSAMIERIHSADPDEKMPPAKGGKPLSKEQIDLLTRWVQQGAKWQKHWAFMPPERASLPEVKNRNWPRNAIDNFVLARLEKEGLKPNPEADKVTLLRRATLDLTGLPPTIEEVDAFLADNTPDAYERVVDRLMLSPHYGERMAQHWLDLARYADTSGYHFDGVRFMWLWRDWVINSFNDNKPFDQFVVEQLAGDLMPNASQSQRVATGFMRNNMTNDEGGADPDEYLDKYVADRVNTFGSVFLGLTVACCECHDHKFDPIKTKEYYQLYAYFHNVPEKGLDRIRTDNPPPRLAVPTPEQAVKFVEADFRLKDAEKTLQDRINELGESQEKWERLANTGRQSKPDDKGLVAFLRLNGDFSVQGIQTNEGRFSATNKAEFVDGRIGKAFKVDGKSHAEFGQLVSFDRTNSFSYGAWVKVENKDGCILSKMEKDPVYRGFDLLVSDARIEVHIINKWPDNALKVRTRDQIPLKQWQNIFATYDGSGKAAGVKIYVNGKRRDTEVQNDKLADSITNQEPVRVGSRDAQYPYTGLIEEVRFYDRALSSEDIRLRVLEDFMPIVAKSRGNRSNEEREEVARFYKENYAEDYLRSEADLAKARKQKDEFYSKIPTTLIMEDMVPGRETFLLVRGDFRNPGERVHEGTPACLPPLPEGPTNRLTLARWLVTKENPLPARVAVNRYWGMFFGTGLVKTENDFGSQGEWPSHPQLLDWLAVQFRDGGEVAQEPSLNSEKVTVSPWNVKQIVRLMLTSATYRQSGQVSEEKLERDPYNRLLTRGPRMRLDAEFIRDNALAVSGLLNTKVGGPSVKPYQPNGIWDGVDATYVQDHGDLLYRRGMYVFWRRSAHYPSFATFDAPNREVCTVYRQTTQTPLQSLVLMNDPVFVEAARALAQRVLSEAPTDPQKRLLLEFRHTLGRIPRPDEIALLQKTYDQQHANFEADPKGAEEFLKIGELKRPEQGDTVELAALASVANVLLNLDETITK